MRRVSGTLAAALGVVALSAAGFVSGAAAYSPSVASATEDATSIPADVLAEQDELLAVVEAVERYVESQGDGTGYSTATIDSDAGTVKIYWVGTVPGEVEAILDDAPEDVEASLIAADYTEDELLAGSKKLTSYMEESGDLGYFVTRVVTNERLGGLEVRITGEANFENVQAELERVAGVPVLSVDSGEAPMPARSR